MPIPSPISSRYESNLKLVSPKGEPSVKFVHTDTDFVEFLGQKQVIEFNREIRRKFDF